MSWQQSRQERLAEFQQLASRGTRLRRPKDWVARLIGSRHGLALLLSFLFVISTITVLGTRTALHTGDGLPASCDTTECHSGKGIFPAFIPCFRNLLKKAFAKRPTLAAVPRYHEASKDAPPPWQGQVFT
jgi:hypothetical protein